MTTGADVPRRRGRPPKPQKQIDPLVLSVSAEQINQLSERIAGELGCEPGDFTRELAHVGCEFEMTKAMRHALPRLQPRRGNRTHIHLQDLLRGCALAVVARDTGVSRDAVEARVEAMKMVRAYANTVAESANQRDEPEFVKCARVVMGAMGQRSTGGTLRQQARAVVRVDNAET